MPSLNRILTNQDRELYKPLIEKMFEVCPEMMSRKISEANVQQAFALEYLLTFDTSTKMCCAGSFEDTACDFLKRSGFNVVEIDPEINTELHAYRISTQEKFDVIFSVSVLEHVKNDEEFIEDICYLLNPGGVAVLTCDFNNQYTKGMPLPATDVRFYTKYDLGTRLTNVLERNNCKLIDDSNWNAAPDFIYQGHLYSFATFVFKKNE